VRWVGRWGGLSCEGFFLSFFLSFLFMGIYYRGRLHVSDFVSDGLVLKLRSLKVLID